jgi:undecaprenyl-diphosphatase
VDGHCGGRYGFVSSHASNTFALLAFLYRVMGRESKVLIYGLTFWAVVVSLSRVYLGVHFPGDVLCGAFLGVSIGLPMGYYCNKVLARASALNV